MQNRTLLYKAFGVPAECLTLEVSDLPDADPTLLRVAMSHAPINPSDLIPISGAYAHRIRLPAVAGYEGVGRVIHAPDGHRHLLGRRVLPLRGAGTWQSHVDCDPGLAIPVPADVDDLAAARAYINPLAALTMLDRWPATGKRVLLSGAGSTCAELLARWALEQGAVEVRGIYRSESRVPRLIACGVIPIAVDDARAVSLAAAEAELTFDSLGGRIGSSILDNMRDATDFVGYGLLSGQNIRTTTGRLRARYHRFHLRDDLPNLSEDAWRRRFDRVWAALRSVDLPKVRLFPFDDWKSALAQAATPGAPKPMLHLGPFG